MLNSKLALELAWRDSGIEGGRRELLPPVQRADAVLFLPRAVTDRVELFVGRLTIAALIE